MKVKTRHDGKRRKKRTREMKRDRRDEEEITIRRDKNAIFPECPPASELIMPSVRCCPAVPELIRTNFRDVLWHPVELKRCPSDPARISLNVRSSGN